MLLGLPSRTWLTCSGGLGLGLGLGRISFASRSFHWLPRTNGLDPTSCGAEGPDPCLVPLSIPLAWALAPPFPYPVPCPPATVGPCLPPPGVMGHGIRVACRMPHASCLIWCPTWWSLYPQSGTYHSIAWCEAIMAVPWMLTCLSGCPLALHCAHLSQPLCLVL